ncbi:MAG: LysM peptidoglycan-binding domain-containing protein [Opitutaceae bacterium]|jgi:LysM repeat protein|nr:LysM peptidoglycan-binding domain-containing protein [Opitutaceae bacterium]
MKILQIFGAVVAVHFLAFIFIFASPGCQSGPRNIPTPDATAPVAPSATQPVDTGTSVAAPLTFSPALSAGHATPTRPGSPAAAALAPVTSSAEVAPVTTYTVVKGDSWSKIAKKNNLSVAALAKANNMSSGTALQLGRKLMIPGKIGGAAKDVSVAAAPAKIAVEKPAAVVPRGDAVKHTVQSGESLGVIARKYQVSTGELAAANSITDPSKVRVGQQLVIPGFKAVGAKSPGAATTKAAPTAVAATPAPAVNTPHFELTVPAPGQDLDAGLKGAGTEVPTIKVETPAVEQPPKK